MRNYRSLLILTLAYASTLTILSIADVWTTQIGLSLGYHETNPFANVQSFTQQFFPRRFLVIVVLSLLVLIGTLMCVKLDNPASSHIFSIFLVMPCVVLPHIAIGVFNNISLIMLDWSVLEWFRLILAEAFGVKPFTASVIQGFVVTALLVYPVRRAIRMVWDRTLSLHPPV